MWLPNSDRYAPIDQVAPWDGPSLRAVRIRRHQAPGIHKSSADFLGLVWPEIGIRFGGVVPVETVNSNAFARELDIRSGIDNWVIGVDGHMYGLASRVQWTDNSFDTFTIRVRSRYGRATEYDKRRREIATDGALRPHYVCQAYVSRDRLRLVAAAMAPMRDVIAAIDDNVESICRAHRVHPLPCLT